MAKYDTYTLTLNVGTAQDNAELKLTVLFEDGDNAQQVIAEARARILVEALEMKDSSFLNQTRQ